MLSSDNLKAFRELPGPVKCGFGGAAAGFLIAVTLDWFSNCFTSQQLIRNELLFFCLCPTIGLPVALGSVGIESTLATVLFVAGANSALYGIIGFVCSSVRISSPSLSELPHFTAAVRTEMTTTTVDTR